ncbi:MAG: hypothetical protein HC906_16030 [Bacteroidales bacterium]|nr:hypothetical protein [Bacteroidales bacterium]
MKFIRLISVLVFVVLFSACEDKKSDKPYIILYPESDYIDVFSEEKVVFTIKVLSDYRLTNLLITKAYEGEMEEVILDSTINLMELNTNGHTIYHLI